MTNLNTHDFAPWEVQEIARLWWNERQNPLSFCQLDPQNYYVFPRYFGFLKDK